MDKLEQGHKPRREVLAADNHNHHYTLYDDDNYATTYIVDHRTAEHYHNHAHTTRGYDNDGTAVSYHHYGIAIPNYDVFSLHPDN